MLCRTFSGTFNIVNIFVGREKKLFQLPKDHICTISYFEKAFNGDFKEGVLGSIDLVEDDPEVFTTFIRWLYRGLDSKELSNFDGSCDMWTKFFLMADKWCIPHLAKELAKQLSNSLTYIPLHVQHPVDGKPQLGGNMTVFQCAELAEGHPIQYLFAHNLYQRQSGTWTATSFTRRLRDPKFAIRCLLWYTVMLRCDTPRKFIYKHDVRQSEAVAHKIDRLILPLLFDDEKVSDDFNHLLDSCQASAKEKGLRAFIREQLNL